MKPLCGVLPVYKPKGWVSTAVSHWLQRKLQLRKNKIALGHVGTLDPLAQGLLPMLCGKATRVQNLLHKLTKTYKVTAIFGYETDSLDLAGEVTEKTTHTNFTTAAIQEACQGFVGELKQCPPLYSAVRFQGKPLYYYARRKILTQVPQTKATRVVHVYRFKLLSWADRQAIFSISCSKGTYVRSLIKDLARYLGSLATVADIVREEMGGLHYRDAVHPVHNDCEDIIPNMIPLARLAVPKLRVGDPATVQKLQMGQKIFYADEHRDLFSWQGHDMGEDREPFFLLDDRDGVFGIGVLCHRERILHMARGLI